MFTEHKRAEEALQTAADQLNLALAAAQWELELDIRTDVVSLSGRAAEIFGIPPAPHMTWAELQNLLHADDREITRQRVAQAVDDRGSYNAEYRILRPDGQHAGFPRRAAPTMTPVASRWECLECCRIITEQKARRGIAARRSSHLRNIAPRRPRARCRARFGTRCPHRHGRSDLAGRSSIRSFLYNVLDERVNRTRCMHYPAPRKCLRRLPMPRNTPIFEPTFRGQGVVRLDDVTSDPR